jgi:DNA mismatch repair protein MutS
MRVKEWQGDVVFLHEVARGTADRSYGIHVARLAGLPQAVTDRANEVLQRLEAGEASSAPAALADDLPLFAAALTKPRAAAPSPAPTPVETALRDVEPDDLSAKAALELVYRLKLLLLEEEGKGHG